MKVEGEGVSFTLLGRTRDLLSYLGRSDLVTIQKTLGKPVNLVDCIPKESSSAVRSRVKRESRRNEGNNQVLNRTASVWKAASTDGKTYEMKLVRTGKDRTEVA